MRIRTGRREIGRSKKMTKSRSNDILDLAKKRSNDNKEKVDELLNVEQRSMNYLIIERRSMDKNGNSRKVDEKDQLTE